MTFNMNHNPKFSTGNKVYTDISYAEDHYSPFKSNGMYYEGVIELLFPDNKYLIRLKNGKSKLIKEMYLVKLI